MDISFVTKTRLPILFLALFLAGCSTLGYYSSAVGGHLEVMQAARPISELLDDPTCADDLKKKLEEVRRIRDFATTDLGLPNNDSYRSYADIKRQFVVWNVFAAPEFSLQTIDWCMLVVGCVGYRGFHDQGEAERLAGELRQQGFDTYVGGVPAYSTLGYFSDPVLNTFLKSGSVEVARLIFHELAHQVLYVDGDTVFNESFATAVENEGLRRWLAYRSTPDLGNTIAAHQQRKTAFVELVTAYRGKLQEIYDSILPLEAKRLAKSELISEIKRSYLSQQAAAGKPPVYKEWLELDLNNAKLASLGLYTQLLPAFEALLAANDHDLPRFYRSAARLGRLPPAERTAALHRLQPDRRLAGNAASVGK
jgi:predicted aminopeptidase